MIVTTALRSLKNDPRRSFFYLLTFVLTTMQIFLFFNIAASFPGSRGSIDSSNGTVTVLTMTTIVVCSVEIIFANNFFIRNKAKDMAVLLTCGCTYVQLAGYLLLQTSILLAISIPTGMLLGTAVIPILNRMTTEFQIAVHGEAIFVMLWILAYIILWTTMVNLGYAYRNSALNLLNATRVVRSDNSNLGFNLHMPRTFKQIVSLLFFFGPVVIYFTSTEIPALFFAVIAIFGFTMMIDSVIIPFIGKMIKTKKLKNADYVAEMGFLRNDLQVLKPNMILLFLVVVFLIAEGISVRDKPSELLLVNVSYLMMNILASLGVMFKYSTEIQARPLFFRSLEHIGYMHRNLKKIIISEVVKLYGFVILAALLHVVAIMIAEHVEMNICIFMIAGFLVPCLICGIINCRYYIRRTIGR